MSPDRPSLLERLRHKFLLSPAGYGRPMAPAVADGEYQSGAWAHFDQPAEQPRQAAAVEYIMRVHAQPAVLDIGCGSGHLAHLLQPHPFRRYVGLDFSPEALTRARALGLGNCEFVQGDFETWRPVEKFDVIVFSESVGYAHDPGALVAAFLRWLEPGGALVISYYRSGHWAALWRRIEQHARVCASTTVTSERDQTWDIKLLRPAGSP